MIHILLVSLVPIFAVMAAGYIAGRRGKIDNKNVGSLNMLTMEFALPAALFGTTARASRTVLAEQWPLLFALLLGMLAVFAFVWILSRYISKFSAAVSAVIALSVSLPNYAAAGIPLASAVFGVTGKLYITTAIVSGAIVMSPLTLAFLEAQKANGGESGLSLLFLSIGRSMLKPLVVAPFLGVAIALLGIVLPDYILRSFDLLGQATAGIALFVTGLILSAQKVSLSPRILFLGLLCNVVQPLLAYPLTLIIPMPVEMAHAVILLMALPAGFFGLLFALRYQADSRDAGSIMVVSTVMSLATLTVALALVAGTSAAS
ncbi:AEC family transporter [Acetobacter sp. TBRC 12305]|uniref:AEC family transporter n=1 Tax=Acetobacter garciniae TaxID=2817435 RepID=A0A939KQH9_9PROT|nr:AEC family transporter [Acetobacter garciniae]MBO1325419.1 AEC family transporter [Acetobacter garciniae]MBX0345409.1 AEC family transporter [Acetobacter garciniae]